jgi:cytochrome P450
VTASEADTSPADVEALRRERSVEYDPFLAIDLEENRTKLAGYREISPLVHSTLGGGFWVATGYDEVVTVLRNNNKGFVSYPNNPFNTPKPREAATVRKLIPIDLDGPEHRQYRKLLDPVFSPQRMQALEPQIRMLAHDLIDEWIEGGSVDFIKGFAFPFSATTVILLMGWTLEDADMMHDWVRILQHGVPGASKEEAARIQATVAADCRAYLMGLIKERRRNPGDDISTMLMNVDLGGRPLSDDEIYDTFLLFMLAGLDTVQSVLAQSFAYLGEHQDKWDEMFADPETLDLAVEEFLRWAAPAPPTRNVTAEYMVVGDVPVPKGEKVHCVLGAANRDPKYYPNPDEIDFRRRAKPHLTFGLGPHRCIGIHLARLEIKIAFAELRARLPEFRLDTDRPPGGHLGLSWGLSDVHLTFPPGSRLS